MIGRVLKERYQVVEFLGHGGIAVVFKAWDRQNGEWVAIKFLQAQQAQNPTQVRRLLREGRTVSQLESPHIVRLVDVDQYGGQYYLVFEYIQGETLRQRLLREGHPLPPLEVLRIARQVLLALDCAWQKRVVHRDLSLSNVVQVPGGLIKVMDFGIAKNYAYDPITRPGEAMGTPDCVSPEQALGKRVDVRSDIYSLGAILYQLLTGRPVFTGGNPIEIMDQHIKREPTPLPQVNRNVPAEVSRIVHRALSKSPPRRFQGPREMIWAIDQSIELLAVRQRTPRPEPRPARPVGFWLGLLLVLFGVMLLGAMILLVVQQAG